MFASSLAMQLVLYVDQRVDGGALVVFLPAGLARAVEMLSWNISHKLLVPQTPSPPIFDFYVVVPRMAPTVEREVEQLPPLTIREVMTMVLLYRRPSFVPSSSMQRSFQRHLNAVLKGVGSLRTMPAPYTMQIPDELSFVNMLEGKTIPVSLRPGIKHPHLQDSME